MTDKPKPALDLDALEVVTREMHAYGDTHPDARTDQEGFAAWCAMLDRYDDAVATHIVLALIARVREAEAERNHWQGELRTEILRNRRMLDVMADEAAIVIRERDELRAKITAHWHE